MASEQASTVDILESTIDFLNKTANGGTPSDPFVRSQWEMSGAHVMLTTGLLSIYQVRHQLALTVLHTCLLTSHTVL